MPASAFVIISSNPLKVLNQISNVESWPKLSAGVPSGLLWGTIFWTFYKIFSIRLVSHKTISPSCMVNGSSHIFEQKKNTTLTCHKAPPPPLFFICKLSLETKDIFWLNFIFNFTQLVKSRSISVLKIVDNYKSVIPHLSGTSSWRRLSRTRKASSRPVLPNYRKRRTTSITLSLRCKAGASFSSLISSPLLPLEIVTDTILIKRNNEKKEKEIVTVW